MPGKPSSSLPIPSNTLRGRGGRTSAPSCQISAPALPHAGTDQFFTPEQPSDTRGASVFLPRIRPSLRAMVCCRIWGEGEPRRRRGRGSPSPQAPHPFPCALLSERMKYDATRKPSFAHPSPGDTKGQFFRPPINTFKTSSEPGRRSRRPCPDAGQQPQASGRKKESPRQEASSAPRHTLHPRGMLPANHAGTFLPGRRTPPLNAQTGRPPASPASRGAKAIPAQRERRSRRAYRPQSGKMRADLPPAASGGQGTRHATATPAAIRDKGEYGGRRGCRGVRPSHPLPLAGRRPCPDAGQQPQASGKKKKKGKPSLSRREATMPGCRAAAAIQRQKRKEERKKTARRVRRPPYRAPLRG